MHITNNDGFSAWEVNLAKGKAAKLVGKYGFTRDDLPDLEQELLLEIFLKRGAGNAWRNRTASEHTVISRVLDNRIRNIIEAACAAKRCVHCEIDSLNKVICYGNDGETITLAERRSPVSVTEPPRGV